MGFNNNGPRKFSKDGGRGSFGGGRSPVTMHDATCSDCNNKCQVPFKPTGEKPVRCSDCFGKNDSRGGRDSFRSGQGRDRGSFSRPAPRPSVDYTKQLDDINRKMDKMIKIMQQIVGDAGEKLEGTEASRERAQRKEVSQAVDVQDLKNIITDSVD